MKLYMLYMALLASFTSCGGQENAQSVHSEKPIQEQSIGDTVTELSNNIMVIYQDTKNNYWFGSRKDGLYKYDGKTIIKFTVKDGLQSNCVEEIKEDHLGNVYVNTSKGLCKYAVNRLIAMTESMNVYDTWKLEPNDVWFKSFKNSGEVYRLNENALYRLKIPPTKLGEDYLLNHPGHLNPYDVYCIYKDSKGNIWFGTAVLGAFRFNGKSFDWISEPDVTELHNGPSNGVRSIAEDKHGDFWFNTEYRYNVYNNVNSAESGSGTPKFYSRVKSIGPLDGKKDSDLNEYLSIIKDNKNNLWIAIYLNGVWKYDGAGIHHYPVQENSKNIPVFCLYKDNKGNIWLGTHENGVYKFNGNSFEKFVH